MAAIVPAFNKHFMELVEDIVSVFPDDVDIMTAKNSFIAVKKINPKLLIKAWDTFVVSKYHNEIENGDISYFLEKDYTEDLKSSPSSKQIIDAIDRLRKPIKTMDDINKNKIVKYLQNLSKLTLIYKPLKI